MKFILFLRKNFSKIQINRRNIYITSVSQAGEKWRLERGLGKCGNEYGPLTDLPDWSYTDGQPAPIASNQLRRKLKNKELAETAMQYINEMRLAKSNCQQNLSIELPRTRAKIYPLASSKAEKIKL